MAKKKPALAPKTWVQIPPTVYTFAPYQDYPRDLSHPKLTVLAVQIEEYENDYTHCGVDSNICGVLVQAPWGIFPITGDFHDEFDADYIANITPEQKRKRAKMLAESRKRDAKRGKK